MAPLISLHISNKGDPFNAHAWITLPDLSILDATYWFYRNREPLPADFSWEDRIIFSEAKSELIEYVPMIVGAEFLQRILRVP